MLLLGSVLFEEHGKTYSYSSTAPDGTVTPIELRAAGVVVETRTQPELVTWDAVLEVRGWSPISEADR